MNKKIFQFCSLVFVASLFLTGCGTNSYNGESQNWLGSYNGYEEYKNKVRDFVITYKGIEGEVLTPVDFEIIADKDDLSLNGVDILSSNTIRLKTECSNCRIALKSKTIIIKLKWNDNEEELILTK